MSESSITLFALNTLIREATQTKFPLPIWIRAEILGMQVNRTGHCYMELIEKSEDDDSIVAKSRATIWAYKFSMLKPFFETTTGTTLKDGIKILVKAEVKFHEVYGLSLNISDIDPSFTMGDMAMRRREIIKKLKASGAMEMNRELAFPSVPQTIAVISSETAAGYGDFLESLNNNQYNFLIKSTLFPAILQGDTAEQSIIQALENIYKHKTSFDAVVIIRGGGSQADLDCFNGYDLAMNIAQFPLPVLTGIGHDRDETIADMVAHRSLKTPTAVAEFLIDILLEFHAYILDLQDRFQQKVESILLEENLKLNQNVKDLHHYIQQYLTEEGFVIKEYKSRLVASVKNNIIVNNDFLRNSTKQIQFQWKTILTHFRRELEQLGDKQKISLKKILDAEKENLKNKEKHLDLIRPERVLARGYSISYANGKAISSVKNISKGDKLTSLISDGEIESVVEKTSNKK